MQQQIGFIFKFIILIVALVSPLVLLVTAHVCRDRQTKRVFGKKKK